MITGCNRGIGKVALVHFAAAGCHLIACARKETEEFSSYIGTITEKYKVSVLPLYFDFKNEEEIKTALYDVIKQKVPIDVLVNNAGVAVGGLLQMTSLQQMKDVFQVNFFSQVLITQIISKWMMRRKKGSIINMGSIAGLDNYAGYTAYGSSKAALMQFTKTIARELSPYNIRVNAIAPSLTATGMAEQMEEKAYDEMKNRSNLNRLAKPEEIVKTMLFLASDDSSFINGQIIRVDGGM